MKKVSFLLVFAFFLAAGVSYAQEVKEEIIQEVQEVQKTEIAVADLPEAVQKTLSETYAGYEVKKAYKTEEEAPKFYAKLADPNGKMIKVALDAEGKVLEQTDIEM